MYTLLALFRCVLAVTVDNKSIKFHVWKVLGISKLEWGWSEVGDGKNWELLLSNFFSFMTCGSASCLFVFPWCLLSDCVFQFSHLFYFWISSLETVFVFSNNFSLSFSLKQNVFIKGEVTLHLIKISNECVYVLEHLNHKISWFWNVVGLVLQQRIYCAQLFSSREFPGIVF